VWARDWPVSFYVGAKIDFVIAHWLMLMGACWFRLVLVGIDMHWLVLAGIDRYDGRTTGNTNHPATISEAK
jgi:hypothetical protein